VNPGRQIGVRTVVVVILAWTAIGCSSGTHTSSTTTTAPDGVGTKPPSVVVTLPTRGRTGYSMDAAVFGPLKSDGRCFTMGSLAVIWPAGYQARTEPLRVLDDKGHLVGRVGERVTLGGGEIPMTPAMLAELPPSTRPCFRLPSGRLRATVWFM